MARPRCGVYPESMEHPSLPLGLRLLRRALRRLVRRGAEQEGQAMVESAIVMPLMVFFILGIIQLVMMQHARIMTEYAAFNAARAGVVWNADRIIMENAAIISLMPTYEGLFDQSDLGNITQMLTRIVQRAALYQKNRHLPEAIDLLKNGTDQIISSLPVGSGTQDKIGEQKDQLLDKAEALADTALRNTITSALGPGDDQMVTVTIHAPKLSDFGLRGREIRFDDTSFRDKTRLSIEVQYLYLMRIPFANWIIHQAWLAGAAGKDLYGAIWKPEGPGASSTTTIFSSSLHRKMASLADAGYYMVPLRATYTMRMQSDPYRQSLEVR